MSKTFVFDAIKTRPHFIKKSFSFDVLLEKLR